MTLTLPKIEECVRKDYILCIDVDDKIKEYIKQHTDREIFDFSPCFNIPIYGRNNKFRLALTLLKFYQEAYSVVTSRLHVAMPCTALETPVILVDNFNGKDGRFHGFEKIVRMVDKNKYLKNLDMYNFNKLSDNPKEYLKFRENLINTCEKFTGYKHKDYISKEFLEKTFGSEMDLLRQFVILNEVINRKDIYSIVKKTSGKKLFQYYLRKILKI